MVIQGTSPVKNTRCSAPTERATRVAHQGQRGVGLLGQDVPRKDPDDPVLRLLARMPPGAEQPRPSLRKSLALDEVRVGVGAERAVEHLRLDGARDDVNRRRDAALAPVRPQPLAEHHQAVALVVDAREEPLVRARQRHQHAGLHQLVSREALGKENVVGGHEVGGVDAEKRDTLHLAQPDAELQQEGRRLREDHVEIPAVGIEDPRSQGHRQMQPGIGLQRDAGQLHRARRQLLGRGVGIMGTDDCDFVTTPSQLLV
jgi:hypothetical protein